MDPRTYAPWIRAINTNTLQMGVTGALMHIQATAFVGGRSPSALQRAGAIPHSPLPVAPASSGRATFDLPPGSLDSTHASAMAAPVGRSPLVGALRNTLYGHTLV